MNTLIIQIDPSNPDPDAIARASEVIRAGGLVAFPTETVYGLAANALDEAAVLRVYEAKGRPAGKPLPVQVASIGDVTALASEIPEVARRLMDAFFPGPLTLVMRASERVPEIVTAGTATVGIRMPDHPVALALIRAAGTPIVAPSANLSDQPSPTDADQVRAYLDGKIEMILDAGPSELMVASTVLDVTVEPPRILRLAVLGEDVLRPYLEG